MGGKRPRSSMSPTIAFSPDTNRVIGLGSAGGSRIFWTNMWSMLRMLDSGDCAFDSMYPRLQTRWAGANMFANALLEQKANKPKTNKKRNSFRTQKTNEKHKFVPWLASRCHKLIIFFVFFCFA